ncbi:PiggyBac transposable element-derived protein 3 [Trichinella murrelli]|uniref:PiggyBac transposable element-derived protein 3 n=1 Tax=Trichinella murrelli TaxID=144512 RepID=A0A0V0UGN7_9BILA|nr:PiggyBac transposable element-derived protein 3 [Trichinella murrelli]
MDFDTIFRETRSGRNVRQIIVLPDPDVSEPDTVSEDELDHTFQQSNSSIDDEVIEEDDASTDARRKSYTWRRRPFNPKTEPFINADEEIPSVLRPIEYFRMYFTAQLLSHISFETNRKATQSLYSNLATTAAEIEVLIGMLITMGVCEMPRYRMYWANQTRCHGPKPSRLRQILRNRKHKPLIESIRKTCLEETPGELQSVDEHIIPYKGRCKMKYFNPRKPDKWGLKVIARCGKNAFVHDFWMCDGMAPKVENSMGFFAADVVIKVCETLPKHKGYKVFFDNYFAFLELQEALLRDGIHSVATIRSNILRGCPVMLSNELKRKSRGATDFCCARDNKLCVVKWFDNREVILASTYKCVDPVEPVRRWDKRQRQFIDVPCPQIVKEYNQFMGGVDLTADCTKNGIEPRNMMDLMAFMLSVSDSLIKLEKTYVTRKRGRRPSEPTAEEEAGPSKTVRRTREPEDITRTDQTGH